MSLNRKSGVLLHISSLPGPYAIGDMGPNVAKFIDFLVEGGFSAWQILPLTITHPVFGDSPYSSPSAFAGNTLLISPDALVSIGLLEESECAHHRVFGENEVDFIRARSVKSDLLNIAYRRFKQAPEKFSRLHEDYRTFIVRESHWLKDFTLFMLLKDEMSGACWNEWPAAYRKRDQEALHLLSEKPLNQDRMDYFCFQQFVFYRQLEDLRSLCSDKGIEFIGDLPIYVGFDSADVWSRQDLFKLDAEGRPVTVTGVPPDYFSESGQRWGNPVYCWEAMQKESFDWWKRRFFQALRIFDRIRIDHFRGFCGFWEIPASEQTAVNGWWSPGPGIGFFEYFRDIVCDSKGNFPFIAEDLGVITDDVKDIMERFNLPGMKVLQFAFGEGMEKNPYIPHMHRRNCVAYTGTHDNNTVLGWWRKDASELEKFNFSRYMQGDGNDDSDIPIRMSRAALSSVAVLAVIPMQDILGLGENARMNRPSTVLDNWGWRMSGWDNTDEAVSEYRKLNELYARCQ